MNPRTVMMVFHKTLKAFAFANATILLLAGSAAAQLATDALGTIEATIDGAPYSAETLDVPSEGTSTAELRAVGPMLSISVQGHDPEAGSRMRNVLTIDFTIMGSDASATMTDASVSYWPEGMDAPFYMSEGAATMAAVDLEALSVEDGAAAAQGSFTATLCRKDDFFSQSDPNDCLPVEGTFDTALRKAE
ncbi:hypothetical protein [Mesorhizobium sp. CAU 1741]|uniref:hypothetical protein n=1 Tax=Mesorhizobium sp. CAU 1741 TaxID=3140366 RepID=UPI00325A777D